MKTIITFLANITKHPILRTPNFTCFMLDRKGQQAPCNKWLSMIIEMQIEYSQQFISIMENLACFTKL